MMSAFALVAIQVATASPVEQPNRTELPLSRACSMLDPNGLINWEQLTAEDALLIHHVEQQLGGSLGATRPDQQLMLAKRCRLLDADPSLTKRSL